MLRAGAGGAGREHHGPTLWAHAVGFGALWAAGAAADGGRRVGFCAAIGLCEEYADVAAAAAVEDKLTSVNLPGDKQESLLLGPCDIRTSLMAGTPGLREWRLCSFFEPRGAPTAD